MSNYSRRQILQTLAGAAFGTTVLQSAARSASAAPTTIRIGWQPTLNGARYFVAQHAGLFAKHGLNVQTIKFTAGPPFFAAFQSKSIDVGFMGTPPAVVGIAQGVPMSIFAIENWAWGSEGLIARQGSGINALTAADLRGKRIATARGSSGDYALQTALAKVGLTVSDIKFIDLAVPALIPAFTRGDIDAGWYWQPWQSEMIEAGGKQITTDGQLGIVVGIVWVGQTDWLAANGPVVQQLLAAINEATPIIARDPEKAAAYIAEDLGVKQSLALEVLTKQASWPTMQQSWADNYALSINPSALRANRGLMDALIRQAKFQKGEGTLSSVPDFMKSIDTKSVAEFIGAKA
jgi:taurine transport system substrate-binding protein